MYMREYGKLSPEKHNSHDSEYMKFVALLRAVMLLVLSVFLFLPLIAGAAENGGSTSALDYRYPADTSGPGLRLLSLLHDTKAKRFEQGLTNPKKRDNKNFFARPRSVAFGNDGQIYTLDGGRGVVFELIYRDGELQSTSRFPADNFSLLSPIDIAVAPNGSVWLTDTRHKAVFIIGPDGKTLDSLAGFFERPIGVVYHKKLNHMLVTDLSKNVIVEVTLDYEIVKTHGLSDSLSGDSADNVVDSVTVEGPSFIAVGPAGNIFVVEALSGTVSIFSEYWKLLRRLGGFGDGPGYFSKPKGIAVDKAGRVYVADALFDNIQIFDESDRLLLTLGSRGSGPGQFLQPMGIAIDNNGDVYIADSYNGRVQVFRWENIEK
jgi:sugar lactone lactonase YvrE